MSSLDARQLVAMLANARTRALYARVVLGETDSATCEQNARDRKSLTALTRAGLVVEMEGGRLAAPIEPIESLLRSIAPSPVRDGIDRFIRNGRIEAYPTNQTRRRELLQWLVEKLLDEDEVLSERAVTERLDGHEIDAVTLRRYLIDEGLLERTRSGSSYARGGGV